MRVKETFEGQKKVYIRTVDYTDCDTGYVQMGTFTVTHPVEAKHPINLAVDPFEGSGMTVTFIAEWTDPQGPEDLYLLDLLVNDSTVIQHAAYVRYNINYTQMQLHRDTGNYSFIYSSLPSSDVLQNSQVKVDLAECTVFNRGDAYVMTVQMEFKTAFEGEKNIYIRAKDRTGRWIGWEQKGTWTVQQNP